MTHVCCAYMGHVLCCFWVYCPAICAVTDADEERGIILGDSIGFLLLIQVILIGLNAIFASAEIAVISMNDAKLEKMAEQGNRKAKRLIRLTEQPARFLATIQVAITLSGFLGSAFAAENFSDPIVDWVINMGVRVPRNVLESVAVVFITLILSYFTLVFGELVPKRIAMKKTEGMALGLSGLVSGISIAFKPVVWFLTVSTNAMLRLCGIDPNEEDEEVSEEEIRMMVDVGSEKGTIQQTEQEFIQNVFEFDDLIAGDIATHRTDVTILFLEDSDEEWAKTIHESRHTRYPICDGSPDEVVGVLNAKDYFRLEDKGRESVMENAVRKAYFVPETIKADVLFRNMQKNHSPLAVVLDEYGGMVGIVTLNDLVAKLVGELSDDSPQEAENEPHIEKTADDTWTVSGNMELRELEEELGVVLENEDYDTFTGLVFDELGTIPQDGEQDLDLTIGRLKIHIAYIEDHQIKNATVRVLEAVEEETEEDGEKKEKDKKEKDKKERDKKEKDKVKSS